jgi:hypothetical protein
LARVLALWVLLATLLIASTARAHGTRSVSVDVTETSPGRALVRVRASTPEDADRIRAVFPEPCVPTPGEDGDRVTLVACAGALAGKAITVEGLGPIVSEAIVVVALHDGSVVSQVVTDASPSFVLPAAQSGLGVAESYVGLGVRHIATGYDHLLFLLALVLVLRRPRAVLLAETAFTLSHTLSFSATALGLLRVSAEAAEAAIALSLVLVALDIGRPADDREASTRDGVVMAFGFGLVHGLGFAGGLREVGLPDAHVSAALAGFALGVEVGQVAFLIVALLVFHLASRRAPRSTVEARVRAGSVLIGSVACYWLVERTLSVLSLHV